MEVFITGAGWITTQGDDLTQVWDKVLAGTPTPVSELPGLEGRAPHTAACIPPKMADAVARHPRLRRASNISLFAAAATVAALRAVGIDSAGPLKNCALVFAATDGGVIYTRKFYEQVVRQGSGSPLLFPETVYNAPASHIAALLGIDGSTYTVVGDAGAGLAALSLAAELLATTPIEHCIVASAQEADWILCEAYHQWRLTTDRSAIEIGSNRGALIADGGAAVVLSRQGPWRLGITPAIPFFRRSEARSSLADALAYLTPRTKPASVVSSANGTFIDRAEQNAVESAFGPLPTIYPKVSLGDPFGAGALMQVIGATEVLRRDNIGPILVPVIGLNEQAGAVIVSYR